MKVALFKTKNESQLKERLELIQQYCVQGMKPGARLGHEEETIKNFNQIFTIVRNIELSDLPLRYNPHNNWEHIDTMEREVAPSVGDTIVLDCGDMVEVLHVSHQWNGDDADLVQVMTRELDQP